MDTRSQVDADKAACRRRLRRARRSLAGDRRRQETSATVSALEELLVARPDQSLVSYQATGSELSLTALHAAIWRGGQAVILPKVAGLRRLTWHAVTGVEQLVPGAYGIDEPIDGLPAVEIAAASLVLVPGVGFGPAGKRLGQGGGFYDAALKNLPEGARTLGIAFSCQWSVDLPVAEHDVRLQACLVAGVLRDFSASAS